MKPREISKKIRASSQRKEKSHLKCDVKEILEILYKINVNPRTIEKWLDSISADEEVIKDSS